jgi:L-fuconolactonase
MKIDAHQHFWQYSAAEYRWIGADMPGLKRDFLPVDFKPLLDAEGFEGSIAVQARQDLDETRWLLELASANTWLKCVVGWVDLCSEQASAQLDQFGQHEKFVGVRHVVQGEPDDEFMLRADFRNGIGHLAEHGLTYDLLLYPRHLPVAVKLVREFEKQRFVLDHIAKPGIADQALQPWVDEIRELAKCENVWCKISGMVTEARWKQWSAADFRPYLDVIFEAFGPERLMVGSDWPVCTLSASYGETLGIVREYIERLSEAEQDAILGGTCAEFYGV